MKRYLNFLWTNRYSVLLACLLAAGAGWFALQGMPKSVFPSVVFPKVDVLIHTDNLPVRFMLLEVTEPMEEVAKGEPGVRMVRSQTSNGITKLHVYFNPGVNPDLAYLMLQARLAHVPLPAGAQMSVRQMTPNIYPFAQYALVSNHIGSAAMMPTFAFSIRPSILSIPGIYRVQGTGRGWPEVDVNLQPRRLAQYHLNPDAVLNALKAAQGPFYSGILDAYHEQFILATTPRPDNVASLDRLTLPLGPPDSSGARTPLPLGAIATIHTGPPPIVREAAVGGYQHALLINISAQQGANVSAIAAKVATRIQALSHHLPQGVHLIKVYDLNHLIHSSLHDTWIALVLGSAIAWVVVLLFLRRWEGSLATLLVVPLAVLATLLILRTLGFGLNVITLGGITAAIGAMIDHAIVVLESGLHTLKGDGRQRRQQTVRRMVRVLPLMTLATLTSCIIFIPLIFLTGTIGILFRQMALAIVIALIISQIVALVLTPILTIWIASRSQPTRRRRAEQYLRKHYMRSLVWGMRHSWIAIPVLGILAAGWLSMLVLPTAFLPHWDEGIFAVPFRTPVGSSVSDTFRAGKLLMRVALKNPNVKQISLVVGRSLDNPYSPPNKGDLIVLLHNHHKASTRSVMNTLRHAFRDAVPNLMSLATQQLMARRLDDLSGSHAPLQIQLFGADSAILREDGKRLTTVLEQSHLFQAINFRSFAAGPEVAITPSAMAYIYGLTPSAVAQQVEIRFWGQTSGFLTHGEQIMPIRVNVSHGSRTPLTFGGLPIQLPSGTFTPLQSIATVHLRGAVPSISRQNLVSYADINLSPAKGEGLSVAAEKIRTIIRQLHLPKKIIATIGGNYREQTHSFEQMGFVLGGSLLLLLVLFGLQFGSQKAAIAALISIGAAASGSLLALLATGIDLDSTAFLGILLIFAIAVNNVILIFSRAQQLGGPNPYRLAVALAARQRFRPILMTMVADVLGFLPLAIGIGHGNDLLRPLAVAVMGGLTIAMVTSLWLAPVLYSLLYGRFSAIKKEQ